MKSRFRGKSSRDVIDALDQSNEPGPLTLGASVRFDQVLLSDGEVEASLPIEGDDFYLSIALYETYIHEC